eukprot:2825684-Amphidinium_carterae.1
MQQKPYTKQQKNKGLHLFTTLTLALTPTTREDVPALGAHPQELHLHPRPQPALQRHSFTLGRHGVASCELPWPWY